MIESKNHILLFPLDFAGTLCARDGIKTGPGTPNGEDAYDRKLVAFRVKKDEPLCGSSKTKEKRKSNMGMGVHFYYHHKCSADVREMLICPCMGAERNTNASNDNPLIIWKRGKPKCP